MQARDGFFQEGLGRGQDREHFFQHGHDQRVELRRERLRIECGQKPIQIARKRRQGRLGERFRRFFKTPPAWPAAVVAACRRRSQAISKAPLRSSRKGPTSARATASSERLIVAPPAAKLV